MRYRLFFFLAAALVALGIGGCAGEGKSSDPLGTDSLTFGDSSGSAVLDLDRNGAVQLTAKVKDAAGKEVAEREVFFELVTNASGATISSTVVNTNTAGEATILYRAGTASGSDVVRASISNGAKVYVSITVGGGIGGAQVALAGSPTSLSAGQNSILTATVTNSAGSPVMGQAVTFAFAANNSGATLATLSGTTDVSGRAVALYTAGAVNPTTSVEDIVQAGVTGSVSPILITRTAVGGVQISLTGAPTSLSAGQKSILTATVTDSAGTPMNGQTITFAFAANNSGATLSTLSGTTDVSGRAIAVYTAGSANPTTSVQDTIQAGVAGSPSVGVVVITRGGGGVTLSLASNATSLAAGQIAVITATVTDGAGAPVSGQAVTFTLSTNNSGATLITLSGTTDASGRAVAQYTAGANSPTISVQDTVLARVPGTAAVVTITRTVGVAAGFQIGVTATPTSLAAGATSIIAATVTNASGAVAAGQQVSFEFVSNASGATLSPLNSGITDAGGKALAVYTAGSLAPTQAVQDVIAATVSGAVAAAIITRQASTVTGNRISPLTATPATLPPGVNTSLVTATVVQSDGVTPVPNVTVSFSLVKGSGTIAPAAVVTNSSGQADAVFTRPAGGTADFEAVQAQILGATGGSAVVIINWP